MLALYLDPNKRPEHVRMLLHILRRPRNSVSLLRLPRWPQPHWHGLQDHPGVEKAVPQRHDVLPGADHPRSLVGGEVQELRLAVGACFRQAGGGECLQLGLVCQRLLCRLGGGARGAPHVHPPPLASGADQVLRDLHRLQESARALLLRAGAERRPGNGWPRACLRRVRGRRRGRSRGEVEVWGEARGCRWVVVVAGDVSGCLPTLADVGADRAGPSVDGRRPRGRELRRQPAASG
mmetsp:Transcript_17587/g.55414  ORF Transcript_17587/g.55414 Transcript_17587/m.55414 type:complete len:236 (+) Transcript_17587:1005-1712(+)